jgi:hypothetical protein
MSRLLPLASYPKSGNTWARMFLANFTQPAPVGINDTKAEGSGALFARSLYDRYLGIKSSMLDPESLDELRPQLARAMTREHDGPLIAKTHDLWRRTAAGAALFPPDVTCGAIYIVRNVLDVAPSSASHWGTSLEEAVRRLCNPNHCLASGRDRLAPSVPQLVGSWSRHVTSWLDDSGLKICLLRYEDMRADPATAFANMLLFAGIHPDRKKLEDAIQLSDFGALKAQEQLEGFTERPTTASNPFFRRGMVGSWREELPAPLIRKLVDVHGETMQRLGYLDENGNPTER